MYIKHFHILIVLIIAHLDQCFEKDKSKIPSECKTIITIANDDPIYSQYNVSLFKFVRSTTSANFSCPLTPRTIVSNKTVIYVCHNIRSNNMI